MTPPTPVLGTCHVRSPHGNRPRTLSTDSSTELAEVDELLAFSPGTGKPQAPLGESSLSRNRPPSAAGRMRREGT
jgi:hypothetical protein